MKKIIKYVKKNPGCSGEDIIKALGIEYEQKIVALVEDKVLIPTIIGGPTMSNPGNYQSLYLAHSKNKVKQTSWPSWINVIINCIKLFSNKI